MKKIFKILAVMLCLTVLMAGCGKKKAQTPEKSDVPEVKQEQNTEKEQEKNEKKEDESQVGEIITAAETDTGVFLGMSDSNFAVIFSKAQEKDVYYAVDRKLNIEKSDVEIGDMVSYTYTADETDAKTITSIKKLEQ